MTLETRAINVRKSSSDECRAAFAFRTCHYNSGAMCVDSSVGEGLVTHHCSIPRAFDRKTLRVRALRIVAWQDQAINPQRCQMFPFDIRRAESEITILKGLMP
jgi:hypothetical protein